jgi:putative transposase
VKFAFVEEHRHQVPVERLCNILDITSRGYRAWRRRPVSQRQRDDMVLLAHIRDQYKLSLGSYGRPRMTEELKKLGLNVGHRRVGRLMRQNGLKVVRTRKYKATTLSNHHFNITPNWLAQNFTADRPNQKWAGDISYIWTREGWSYLSVILDLHSRRIIGWAVSNRPKSDLAIQSLNMAIALRNPPPGCIHHSDRGSQYCSLGYQKQLRQRGFKVSMSGKGNCYDNAAVEAFFKTIKAELIWR